VEIAASEFGECEIDVQVHKWLNVGIAEKLSVEQVYVAPTSNSSFTVHSLFKDFTTVIHSGAMRARRISRMHTSAPCQSDGRKNEWVCELKREWETWR
jgi:hypothetical protein